MVTDNNPKHKANQQRNWVRWTQKAFFIMQKPKFWKNWGEMRRREHKIYLDYQELCKDEWSIIPLSV